MKSAGKTWAVIDARGVPGETSPAAIVGGIPLVVRILRTAARLGWSGAAVRVEPGGESRMHELLLRYPIQGDFEVRVDSSPAAPEGALELGLDGRALYSKEALAHAGQTGSAPEPKLVVKSRRDARRAERTLFASVRKSIALDGVIAYFVMRPASRLLTRRLLGTRVSPNAATFCALLSGLTAAFFAALGGSAGAALAGLLYFLSGILDCVDGELARLRLQSSKLGEWFDSATDEIITYSLLAGLGVGLARDGYGQIWALAATGGSLLGVLTVARLYWDLHRFGLPIDTAQYPWFFSGAGEGGAGAATGDRGAIGKLFYGFGYLIRRDANVTVVALLLIFDLRRLTVGLLIGAVVAVFSLTAVHIVVTARRSVHRREGAQVLEPGDVGEDQAGDDADVTE